MAQALCPVGANLLPDQHIFQVDQSGFSNLSYFLVFTFRRGDVIQIQKQFPIKVILTIFAASIKQ